MAFQSSIVEKFQNQIKEKKEYFAEAKRTLQDGNKVDTIKHKLNQNIKENKMRLNNVQSEIKQKRAQMKHLQKELENQRNTLATSKQDIEKCETDLRTLDREIQTMQVEIKSFDETEEDINALKEEQ